MSAPHSDGPGAGPPSGRSRLWDLFDQAADLPPAAQRAFLDAACAADPGLRARVEQLLAQDARLQAEPGTDFLQSPLRRSTPEPAPDAEASTLAGAPPPGHFGRYRVRRLLGQGGMGAVYEAEQDNPRRRVALKVMRPGLVAPPLLKRFDKEAQILGRLHHPGIASVYEAGLAEDGRPFFAMELIDGLPLDAYGRLHGLADPARLELLARVCDAVQHAHEHGIIHRDLKPANVLVDETGQPKVLDFGVAHATDADLQTTTGRTEAGQLLGTLSYMSPEQVAGDPAALDQRSDVYALGVILFELLAERLPYPLEHLPVLEVARVIREREPSRLGTVNTRFRGDIETIVGKALEKDKAQRYASARELALDIRRYLANEPIRARPPSALYQLRKFARRHKALVGGALATVLALVLGLVGTILFAVGEARQRRAAEHNARVAENETREARFQTYRARLAAAVAALAAHDVADAKRQLDEAPEELRDWEWRHLSSRLDDSSVVVPLPPGGVGFPFGALDTLRVGTFTSAGLCLTDLEGGPTRTLPIYPAPGRQLAAVTQTRRGLRVVAWAGPTTFELLDEAGQVLCRVETRKHISPRVAVSPDGTRLAYSLPDRGGTRLAVFDASSSQRTAVCEGHRGTLWAFTFSPDGTRLVTCGEDRVARVWDAATGALLATCEGHTSKVLGAAFRRDGKRLVTASADGTVRQWDAATGEEVEVPYDRHSGEVGAAVYSPDGQLIASAGADRAIRVWRATGRQDVAVLHGHTGAVSGLAFAPDGRRLASLSVERVFAWVGDKTVRAWDVDPQATLPVLRGHDRYVYPVAFSADGRWLASGSWDKTVRLWDAATGAPCATLPHPGIVRTLAFGPDSRWLITGGDGDGLLRVWDVATARVRKEIRGPGKSIRLLTVSPDGRRVAAHAASGQQLKNNLSVCDVASGEQLFAAEGGVLAYSPDGRWLASLDTDSTTVLLRDARTHETAARLSGHEKLVYSAAFSPDGRCLASCSQDGTVRLWQIDSLPSPPGKGGGDGVRGCRVLRGYTDEVFAAAFHPDGRRLAIAGRHREVWLWDLARGEEVVRLPGHTSYIWSLAFSPDGATLASGSGDFTVRLWDTAPLKKRYQARRDAQALRPEAERLVARLFREKRDAAAVVAALRSDGTLDDPLRHAAVRAMLRRQQLAAYREMSLAVGCVLRLLEWGVAVPLPYGSEM